MDIQRYTPASGRFRWYTTCMKDVSVRLERGHRNKGEKSPQLNVGQSRQRVPQSFRPLLWSLRWRDIDIDTDKEDIILNTVNDGSLEQWRWLIATYGRDTVREVLEKRLSTELHPESRNLAKVVFGIRNLAHARKNSH